MMYLATMLLGIVGGVLVTVPAVMAGTVGQVTPVAIGTIDLHPGGDTITIAAENGPTSPVSERSLVTGGGSGLITITSTDSEHVEIIYPQEVTLSDGSKTITLSDIPAHSEYDTTGVDLPGGGIAIEISVGGKIVLPGNVSHGSYSGSMPIQLNFF